MSIEDFALTEALYTIVRIIQNFLNIYLLLGLLRELSG
jgi:hypothetical protein